jgi:hypothetical protein
MTNASNTPANWYPDPSQRHEHRYWDGAAWTQDVANAGVRSAEPLAQGRRPQPVHKVPGSVLLVGGLRKYLLWGPIVAGVGMGMSYGSLFAGGATGWLVVGGLIAIVGASISIAGILQLIQGVGTLAPLVEVAAQESLNRETTLGESWPAPSHVLGQDAPRDPPLSARRMEDEPLRVTPPGTRLPRPSDRRR